jgi:hypothetical protein
MNVDKAQAQSSVSSKDVWVSLPFVATLIGCWLVWGWLESNLPTQSSYSGTSIIFKLDTEHYFTLDGVATMTIASSNDFTLIPLNGNAVENSIGGELASPPLAWPHEYYYERSGVVSKGEWELKDGQEVAIQIDAGLPRQIVVKPDGEFLRKEHNSHIVGTILLGITGLLVSLTIAFWDTIKYW